MNMNITMNMNIINVNASTIDLRNVLGAFSTLSF